MEELVQPILAKIEQERLDKIKEETTQLAIERIKKMEEDGAENSGKLSFVYDYYIHLVSDIVLSGTKTDATCSILVNNCSWVTFLPINYIY